MIQLCSSDRTITFITRKRRFPIKIALFMTNAEGQTFVRVAVHPPWPGFSHCHLNAAFSRSSAFDNIAAVTIEGHRYA
jgi:hypothetical protein